jgi:hypothetical protein
MLADRLMLLPLQAGTGAVALAVTTGLEPAVTVEAEAEA